MRTALVTAAVLALAVAVPAAPGQGTTAARASLRVVSVSPLTLVGSGFRPSERVVVTLLMRGGPATKAVSTRTGRFVVRFRRSAPCGLVVARATGSAGSRAVARVPGGACIEPGPDG